MKSGFTLMELLVGIALSAVVLMITAQQEIYSAKHQRATAAFLDGTNYLNETLDFLESDLKNVGFGLRKDYTLATGAYALTIANASTIRFTTNIQSARAMLMSRAFSCPTVTISVSRSAGFNVGDGFQIYCPGQPGVESGTITGVGTNQLTLGSVTSSGGCGFSTATCFITGIQTITYTTDTTSGSVVKRNSQNLVTNGSISFEFYDINNNLIADPTTNIQSIRAIRPTVSKTLQLDVPQTVRASRLIPLDNLLGVN